MEENIKLKTCKCGHNKTHYMVSGKGEYTGIGWFLNLFGISYKPIKVYYQCLRCDQRFDETTDPDALKKFQ